ncbi:MAG: regulatory protein RecX [Deltaproteobacteria bacterium]|nr:regulatory protein RecX [Deltaproteobacteria bacterium]
MNDDADNRLGYRKAMKTAGSILARRGHTCNELSRKLYARGYAEDIVKRVVSECRRMKYLDDAQVARLLTEELIRKGLGIHRIRQDMHRRGLSHTIIEQTLSDCRVQEREPETARRVLKKKTRMATHPANPAKETQKHIRFLQSRGFTTATLAQIMNEAGFM